MSHVAAGLPAGIRQAIPPRWRVVAAAMLVIVAVGCASQPTGGVPPGAAGTATTAMTATSAVGALGGTTDPGVGSLPVDPSASAVSSTVASTRAGARPAAFVPVANAMRTRLAPIGGRGFVLVVRDRATTYEEGFGGATRNTVFAVASNAKWLTSSVMMTLVDEGRLTLDDPVSQWLPSFGDGDHATITIRQLLTHTSGIDQDDCIWNLAAVMAQCVERMATRSLLFTPGTQFSYGNGSYHVAGRVIEVVTGTDFQSAFRERIGGPLGFTDTSFGGTRNPSPAAGARTSVADTARFLEMMLAEGVAGGRRVLSESSVRELERNQVVGFDTSRDYAVGITRIPTYGLGTWRDHVTSDDTVTVVSGNGGSGYYPWIDRAHDAYGIIGVEDQRGAEVAVPASKVVMEAALAATNAP